MSFLTTFSDESSKTYKDAARTATTGPINLSSAPASIGSVNLNLNDRVLVKDQLNGADNGIYVFKGAGLPMVRSTDANTSREVLPNMLISVSEGDYEDKIFELTTNGPILLGTTPLSFGLAILPIDLTTDVVGVLPVANGGTNRSSWTEGRIPFAGSSGSSLTEDSELNWVNSTKRLGIGTASPNAKVQINNSGTQVGLSVYSTSTNNALQFFNQGTTSYTAAFYNSADSAQTGASIGGYFSRGTLGARTQSLANDVLLSLTGSGYTGSAFAPSVSGGIVVAADQNTTAGGFGGQVSIVTTPNDTLGLPLPRLTVKNNGNVGIGTVTPGNLLHVEDNVPTTNLYLGNIPGSVQSPGSRSTAFLNNLGGDAILFLANNDQTNAIAGNLANNGSIIEFCGKYSSTSPASFRTFARVGGFKENNDNFDNAGYLSFYTRAGVSSATISERMRITSNGQILAGTSAARTAFFGGTFIPRLQLEGDDNSPSSFSLVNNFNGSAQVWGIVFGRNRSGTNGGFGLVADDDTLGNLYFTGSTSTTLRTAARIRASVDGIPSDTAMPGKLQFYTVPAGSLSVVERMRIDNAGNVGIGTTTPSEKLTVDGEVSFTSATGNSSNGNLKVVGTNENAQLRLRHYGSGTAFLNISTASGTLASPGPLLNAGWAGVITGSGYDGVSSFAQIAKIRFVATGATSPTNHGGRIIFDTNAFNTTGSANNLPRMVIGANGNVGINNGDGEPTERLQVVGNVQAQGLLLQSRHALTGAVTVLSNDYYIGCNSSGGAVTVALQAAATAKQGRKLVIKAESSLANVTINAAAGETIDGSASHVLNVSYESVTLVCNGVNGWFIV